MPTFGSKKFRPSSYNNSLPARYRAALAKHPFALFGLPFVGTMLLGSFFLTPATALRYERHDRKVKTMTEDERLGIGKDRRRIDMKEEYYVSCCGFFEKKGARIAVGGDVWDAEEWRTGFADFLCVPQKLAAKDLDNWEQKRVKRLPGEHDGVL
jgi:cytochrome c oxidase assembly protein subunit 16